MTENQFSEIILALRVIMICLGVIAFVLLTYFWKFLL